MALTGFDPEVVSTSIGNVNTAYESLMTAMHTNVNTFVSDMGTMWACQKAIDFFATFKEVADSNLKGAFDTFQNVVDAMNSAARAWATSCDTAYSNKDFVASVAQTIDVSPIKENIDGVRGIDVENTETKVSDLNTILTDVSTALGDAKTAVTTCGFVGGDQASSLSSSLDTIKSKLEDVVEQFKLDVETAIDDTVAAYGDTAGKISDAFTVK